MKRLLFIALICSIFPLFAATSSEQNDTALGVDRYAIYVGSNKGGQGREQLLYAGSDAQNFKKIMSEIGGVQDSNSWILIDPTKESIDSALASISQRINSSQSKAKRSEFIFYYSGHSDENALLLGDVPYDYSTLKAAITEVPSDIHIVILDSCYSGNFIRTKGGQKRKPFLMDDASVVKGHAYLSSSSDNEFSQESDEIESSYFTNAMITGLRGAADASGDNKVTLNELYSYAFNDTLSKTESSKAGPQHPNFNITLVGSGDLVLSDITNAEAMLSLSKSSKGRFIIRDAEGKLISEINKVEGQPIFMALPAGQYSAVIIDEYSTKQGYFILEKDQVYVLDQNSLSSIKRKSNRLRGTLNASESEDEDILSTDDLEEEYTSRSRRRFRTNTSEDSEQTSETELPDESAKKEMKNPEFTLSNTNVLRISFVPGLPFFGWGNKDYTLVSLGMLGTYDKNITLLQASSIANIVSGNAFGAQLSGVFNYAGAVGGFQGAGVFNISGNLNGGQSAGVFNIAKDVKGAQLAGVFNIADDVHGLQMGGVLNVAKKVTGAQIGIINFADENDGIALGLFNYIKNGKHHLGLLWDTNDMIDFFYQSGTNSLFFTLGMAADRSNAFSPSMNKCILYGGIGTQIKLWIFSFDVEFLAKHLADVTRENGKTKWKTHDYSECFIPSTRLTWNVFGGEHVEFNLGATFDFHNHGVNDVAFEALNFRGKMNDSGNTTVYASGFIGFKIK